MARAFQFSAELEQTLRQLRPEPFSLAEDPLGLPDFNLCLRCGGQIPSAAPRVLTYSQTDVIDKRISVPAQHSLVRLSRNPTTSADAVAMVNEIKANRLRGIFCANWKEAAERARAYGKSWWNIIWSDDDAVLLLDPFDPFCGQPLIAFRRELSSGCGLLKGEKRFTGSPLRLDAALMKAWSVYKLWCKRPDLMATAFEK